MRQGFQTEQPIGLDPDSKCIHLLHKKSSQHDTLREIGFSAGTTLTQPRKDVRVQGQFIETTDIYDEALHL